ncbi:penicillin-binding protein 1C [Bacteroidota bacterium]
MTTHSNRTKKAILIFFALLISFVFGLIYYAQYFKQNLFNESCSTVLVDKEGKLIGARIASDGQWRFPPLENIPEKYKVCLLAFEDEHFYDHPGFNPLAFVRAAKQNYESGKIVSGGSTITMQVMRISGKGKSRTYLRKIKEIFQSVLLELITTKDEILSYYASNAPYGGNVVGLDAASWRYFNRDKENLSWAESALLAVLPNSPSMIHPGKNRKLLKAKRDRLLMKLLENRQIDILSFQLAVLEPIPEKPNALPQISPHLLDRVHRTNKGLKVVSTIDKQLQKQVNRIAASHIEKLSANEIHNMAVLVADIETGNVLAYVGNTAIGENARHQNYVDVVKSPRSPGSVLKPILYALMLEDGLILPNTLIPDVPTFFAGYSPKNFNSSYDGAVPAKQALSRSLNVPAVLMLKDYDYHRFAYMLKSLGMKSVNKPADHYGLSLILGGAEVSLWEIVSVYAGFSRMLNQYYEYSGLYAQNDFRELNYILSDEIHSNNRNLSDQKPLLSAASVYLTYDALLEVNRPLEEINHELFASTQKIAWKTGTSFGFKDAWAVGTSSDYIVGVWVGNADGEGRPGIVGVEAAAPVLFDIFRILPNAEWFDTPFDELNKIAVCSESGHRPGEFCENIDSVYVTDAGLNTEVCPYHQLIHLDPTEKYRVNMECENVHAMVHKSWFVLPAVMEWYYKSKNPLYKSLPSYKPGCNDNTNRADIEFIYPVAFSKIYVPTGLSGIPGKVVFEIAHRNPKTIVYWHLDETYLGESQHIHQMECNPLEGEHLLRVVDEDGVEVEVLFEVVK